MSTSLWMSTWTQGIWNKVTEQYRNPSFVLPSYLQNRYNTSQCTYMPAGPYVKDYSLKLSPSSLVSKYGYRQLHVDLNVNWRPETSEMVAARESLLGQGAKEVNLYHSQVSISGQWLLLNEINRKIERTRTRLADVQDMSLSVHSQAWEDCLLGVHQHIRDNLKWDPISIDKYVKEHAASTVIPSSLMYRGKKWSQLSQEELEHLYELTIGYLDYLVANWTDARRQIIRPNAVGRGVRARSPEVQGISTTYSLEVERSRQVAFVPYLSTWFCFMNTSAKQKMWEMLRDTAEQELGCKVLLPPLEGGAYWKTIADLVDAGNSFVNGDGSNWEAWSATIAFLFCQAVNDGIPQYLSGAAMTSFIGTFANLKSTVFRVPNISKMEAVGVLGDDQVIVGKDTSSIKDLEGVWEIDPVATKYKIVLGMVILPDGKGTFPGNARITIDRGDKRLAAKIGDEIQGITSPMPPESFNIYHEIMCKGTLNGEPLLTKISGIGDPDFWNNYATNRYDYLASGEQLFLQMLPEAPDDYIED